MGTGNKNWQIFAGINLNPYQGLKRSKIAEGPKVIHLCRNQPKSLSGIETRIEIAPLLRSATRGINLNPYQGLKRIE